MLQSLPNDLVECQYCCELSLPVYMSDKSGGILAERVLPLKSGLRHYQDLDDTAKFSINKDLIRERQKAILDQVKKEGRISLKSHSMSVIEKGILLQQILDEIFGYGILGPLIRDPRVREICAIGSY